MGTETDLPRWEIQMCHLQTFRSNDSVRTSLVPTQLSMKRRDKKQCIINEFRGKIIGLRFWVTPVLYPENISDELH